MANKDAAYDMLVDYITGKPVPNIGVEEIRQRLEQVLVEEKGYDKKDVEVDAAITIDIDGVSYDSRLDLVVSVEGNKMMVIKCAAGSLESREREVVSAARVYTSPPVPYAVVSDSRTAVIYDTVTGKKVGEGLDRIFSHSEAIEILSKKQLPEISEQKLKKDKIVFRSYDSMNVNVLRNK